MNNIKKKILKITALFLLLTIITEVVFPVAAYALTNGPVSPEFSSFEPVSTTDMVNVFSGDFNYNLPVLEIPGPDGGGYALSLSYKSGSSPEEEASWVGYGWTLNPGNISRETRGFPDDYNNVAITQYNKTPANWTAASTADIGLELFGADASSTFGISASSSLRFNNSQGFGRTKGLGLNVLGMVSLGMSESAEGTTFSARINPAGILSKLKGNKNKEDSKFPYGSEMRGDKKVDKRRGLHMKSVRDKAVQSIKGGLMSGLGSAYGLFNFSDAVKSTSMNKYRGISFNFTASGQINVWPPIGAQLGYAANMNLQSNERVGTNQVYGYMYNPSDPGNDVMSDYYLEKGGSYSKRDYFIGIPFNNADNFSVSGEGLGGGFRFYQEKAGHFYPDITESKTSIANVGLEFMVGGNIGIGLDLGVGQQKLKSGTWGQQGETTDYKYSNYSIPKRGFFRFNNDMGGKVEYALDNEVFTGEVSSLSDIPGFKSAEISMPVGTAGTDLKLFKYINQPNKNIPSAGSNPRSSFVNYHTYSEITNPSNAFNKSSNVGDMIYRSGGLPDGVAEIAITNEDGNDYIYGLPTYTRNEASYQFDVKSDARNYDNYLVHQKVYFEDNEFTLPRMDDRNKTVVGEVKRTPYSNNYLLTQIVTPDYVDVSNDGPDATDFGGWTKFQYHKAYGGDGLWYRYRSPYTGFMYDKNQLSDTKDDVASVSMGEKEVYYLKTIETKTHIAYFITNKTTASRFSGTLPSNTALLQGSGVERTDALGALRGRNLDESELSGDREGAYGKGNDKLEYLEKIVLFAKSRMDKPLKTTMFEYAASGDMLVQNIPNNFYGNFPENRITDNSGKLTLRKIWFEYEGVVKTRTSPYIFRYEYKDARFVTEDFLKYPEILTKYQPFTELTKRYSKEAQNPNYNPHLLDAWGNIQYDGKAQHRKMRSWLWQGDIPNASLHYTSFDPAAWQLKQIRMPSGAEILVEYEQKDYQYVQDRKAMGLVSLVNTNNSYGGNNVADAPYFLINTEDIGVVPSEYAEYIALIKNHFGYSGTEPEKTGAKDKMYFKFLYALTGNYAGLDDCKSEYITGYSGFKNAEIVTYNNRDHIKITLDGSSADALGSGEKTMAPRQACYDFVATQRLGKVSDDGDANCVSVFEKRFDGVIRDVEQRVQDGVSVGDYLKFAVGVMPDVQGALTSDLASSKYKIPEKESVCMTMKEELSYLKLPLLHAKRGGGVRVKRIYMFDRGIESGDAALYGSEYLYENEDGLSSGVASNEPATLREENPLVTFLPKKNQSLYSKLTAGVTKDQTEGPIGESLLPGPSIGHSRIVVKNIHSGKTGTGFTIHEYFTCKEYPFDKNYNYAFQNGSHKYDFKEAQSIEYSSLDDNRLNDKLNIPAGLINFSTEKVYLSQGFRFIINSMNGQMKRMASYGGNYDEYKLDKTKGYLVTLQEHTYFEPGEKIKMLNPNGTYYWDSPGKEMDVAMEMRSIEDNTMDLSLEIDISVSICITPPVFFTLFPSFQMSNNLINTHATSKVIRYPVITKSILNYADGVYSFTENLAYNPNTGQPVLTRTGDGFDRVKIDNSVHDGSIYSLTIPASWHYPLLGQKALNPSATNQLNLSAGSFTTYGSGANPLRDEMNTPGAKTWISDKMQHFTSASVQTFSTSANTPTWFDSDIENEYTGLAAARAKLDKVWRPNANYVYKTDSRSSNNPGANQDKITSGGVFEINSMFNWADEFNGNPSSEWIKTNNVTKYSPNGNALEERNVLGIYSAAKFDYNKTLPVMIAQNAEYSSIGFNDFENINTASSVHAHSGYRSLYYNGNPSEKLLQNLKVTNGLLVEGGLLRLWLKSNKEVSIPSASVGSSIYRMDRIAQTGDWTLFSLLVPPNQLSSIGTGFDISLLYPVSVGEQVFVDDVRFQPYHAQTTCYVYDRGSLRLLAQFDDQHFGMFYQYNEEGKLVRKIVETERGLKTVQETQYNTPLISREYPSYIPDNKKNGF